MPCGTLPCHVAPCHALPCLALPYPTLLCCAKLCHAMPPHSVSRHATLFHVTPSHPVPCHTKIRRAIPHNPYSTQYHVPIWQSGPSQVNNASTCVTVAPAPCHRNGKPLRFCSSFTSGDTVWRNFDNCQMRKLKISSALDISKNGFLTAETLFIIKHISTKSPLTTP